VGAGERDVETATSPLEITPPRPDEYAETSYAGSHVVGSLREGCRSSSSPTTWLVTHLDVLSASISSHLDLLAADRSTLFSTNRRNPSFFSGWPRQSIPRGNTHAVNHGIAGSDVYLETDRNIATPYATRAFNKEVDRHWLSHESSCDAILNKAGACIWRHPGVKQAPGSKSRRSDEARSGASRRQIGSRLRMPS